MIAIPETRYVKSGDVHIAYQAIGDGPVDLVYLSSWDLAIDFHWDEPSQVQFFEQLASFSRLILFDKRGTGASDSVSLDAMPTLESWVDDVQVVMDAVGSQKAAVLATTWTGPLAVLFAAACPERTSALVLAHTWARLRSAPDYPLGFSESVDEILALVEKEWGTGNIWAAYAPGLAGDDRLRRWWNRCARLSISPATAVAFTTMMANSDVRSVLTSIQAPTLVVTTTDPLRAGLGRYLADHITAATFLSLEGPDNLPWLCHTLAGHIEEFVTGVPPVPQSDSRARHGGLHGPRRLHAAGRRTRRSPMAWDPRPIRRLGRPLFDSILGPLGEAHGRRDLRHLRWSRPSGPVCRGPARRGARSRCGTALRGPHR